MLGRAFQELLEQLKRRFEAARYPGFDITSAGSVERHVTASFDVVINCSAWTDVDAAEAREAEAAAVNAEGVGRLATRARQVGARLVHFSTEHVFDGTAAQPYAATDPRRPVNAYGRTKARGEELFEESRCRGLLIRTSWLYAPWGRNFVRTIARIARQREELRVVDDQRGRPTSAEHLARTSLALLDAGAAGTFHVTDGGECSRYELAQLVAAAVEPSCRVLPCSSSEFPLPARRPRCGLLDLSETERTLGREMPSWRTHVADVVRRLEPL
jgi:dTDP-4-dehydrorhamnose reductase